MQVVGLDRINNYISKTNILMKQLPGEVPGSRSEGDGSREEGRVGAGDGGGGGMGGKSIAFVSMASKKYN